MGRASRSVDLSALIRASSDFFLLSVLHARWLGLSHLRGGHLGRACIVPGQLALKLTFLGAESILFQGKSRGKESCYVRDNRPSSLDTPGSRAQKNALFNQR